MKPSVEALEKLFDAVVTGLADRLADDDIASAADFSNAIKLLKDNNITAVIEDNSSLTEMQSRIEAMRAKRKSRLVSVPTAVTDDEAAEAVQQAVAAAGGS
jgi:uncharacterized protein involved in exopolysaccharide biosynthesis